MTDYSEQQWNGYRRIDFLFDGKAAALICPENAGKEKKWLFKTEYLDAFPAFEIAMLERGYFVAHVDNETRWCLNTDTERQARFARYLHEEFGLNKKCMPVGMSCGGMQAVYFADEYPELVAAMYLDAPVLNLLSCPCGIGSAGNEMYNEFRAATGKDITELINYRNHPIDNVDRIIENRIPVFLVCGDSDTVVPYNENGYCLAEKYEKTDIPFVKIVKPNCDHHPHGLDSQELLIEFAEKYYL